jgi:oligopeptide transport system permease protein
MQSFYRFLYKRFTSSFLSLTVVITATFFLMHSIPGDPFTQEQALPKEILASMKAHYGLDKPLLLQYIDYIKHLLCFDLGPSLKYPGRSVTEIIKEGFPISCMLGAQALFLSVSFGVLLGAIAAFFRGRWQDTLFIFWCILGISIPSFILGTFLQYLFSMKISLFPIARWGSYLHTVLPTLSLAALPTTFIARLTRSSMIDVLEQDYILAAKAKGLSNIRIFSHHVLRNAMLPILSYLGPLTASILTGGFAVEKIFGIPGLGQWFVLSITNRDYTVIMGVTLFYAAFLLLCIFIMDIVSSYIDPRIPLTQEKS